MYINKIKKSLKEKGISIKSLAENLGFTNTGFHQALSNNTLKVRDLERIAEFLDIPVAFFFSTTEEGKITLQEAGRYKDEILLLKNKLESNEVTIKIMFAQIVLKDFYLFLSGLRNSGGFLAEKKKRIKNLYRELGLELPKMDKTTGNFSDNRVYIDLNNKAIGLLEKTVPHLIPVLMLGADKWANIQIEDYPLFIEYVFKLAVELPDYYMDVKTPSIN